MDDYRSPDRNEQFLDLHTNSSVRSGNDSTRANTYDIGDSVRVWIHHAEEWWAGVSKPTRRKLNEEENRQLVHLFIIKGKGDFRQTIQMHYEDITPPVTRFHWYVLPDKKLDRYSTSESDNTEHVNENHFEEMEAYKFDGENLLLS